MKKNIIEQIFKGDRLYQENKTRKEFIESLDKEIEAFEGETLPNLSCNILEKDNSNLGKDDFLKIYEHINKRFIECANRFADYHLKNIAIHLEQEYPDALITNLVSAKVNIKLTLKNDVSDIDEEINIINNCKNYDDIVKHKELFEEIKVKYSYYYSLVQKCYIDIFKQLINYINTNFPEEAEKRFEKTNDYIINTYTEIVALTSFIRTITEKYYCKVNKALILK